MFNLIVGFTEGSVDTSRMLEYTDNSLQVYVAPNNRIDPSRLLNLPNLVMPETTDFDSIQTARIGRLNHLTLIREKFRYGFTSLHEVPSALVEAVSSELDIVDWEFQRHHWAIKDSNLYGVLGEHISPIVQPREVDERTVDLLIELTSSDADFFLHAVSAELTKANWGYMPKAVRRLEAKKTVQQLSPQQVFSLNTALEENWAQNTEIENLGVKIQQDSKESSKPQFTSPTSVSVSEKSEIVEKLDEFSSTADPAGPIFVVHGHDHAVLHLTVRVLQGATGREVVVLHEKASRGRTILEKFEHHAASAAFAVVLLTADDEGGAVGSVSPQRRARQNVIFELGFFFSQLGRDRVVVLVDEGVEKPSDINGLVYITLDSAGAWKNTIGRELEAASIPVNYSKIP